MKAKQIYYHTFHTTSNIKIDSVNNCIMFNKYIQTNNVHLRFFFFAVNVYTDSVM